MTTIGERVAKMEATMEGFGQEVRDLAVNLDTKHTENRKSIHALRNGQESLNLKLTAIRAYAAGAAAVGGIATGVALHFIDKIK